MGGRGSSAGIGLSKSNDWANSGKGWKNFERDVDPFYPESEYVDDNGATVQWFVDHTNAYDLYNEMSYEEAEAFISWTQGDFMSGQQYYGFSSMSKEDQKSTRIFDKYLDRATTDTGFVVRRLTTSQLLLGNEAPTLAKLKALEGTVIKSDTNLSTAAANQGLLIGGVKNTEYVIHIPEGAQGAGMWIGNKITGLGDYMNFWGDKQSEFMLNRDIWLKVGKTTWNAKRQVYEVELLFMGRDKHNYK